jgi:hypothetical protein
VSKRQKADLVRDSEIKRLLQSYRPGDVDKEDPIFREALERVARDPQLAEWFRQEQKFDAVMVEKFREVPVDAAARKSVLQAIQAARLHDGPGKETQ